MGGASERQKSVWSEFAVLSFFLREIETNEGKWSQKKRFSPFRFPQRRSRRKGALFESPSGRPRRASAIRPLGFAEIGKIRFFFTFRFSFV